MLSGEGNENCKKTIGLISKKATLQARSAHFFVHFFAVVLHDYNVKLQQFLSYSFFGGNVVRVLVHFYFL